VSEVIASLDVSTFDDQVRSGTWLVDFWAEWCQPCHALHAVLEEIVPELPDDVAIGRVQITRESDLAARFEVSSVPTIVVLHDGEVRRKLFGTKNRRQLLAAITAARGDG
jgi:thioredoxin 1